MEIFPVEGTEYTYANRFGTGPGDHHGTDVFAKRGTPLLAAEDGTAHADTDPKGGIVVHLRTPKGTRYYYAHLDGVVPALDPKKPTTRMKVQAGDRIGFVGNTGNAAGKAPHLHLQMKNSLGNLLNPYPWLRAVDSKNPSLFSRLLPPDSDEPKPARAAAGIGALFLIMLLLRLKN